MTRGSGIIFQCVACHQRRLLTFDEAKALTDLPFCEQCYMPMVALEARASVSVKGGKVK